MVITGLAGGIANRLSVKKNQEERGIPSEVYIVWRTAITVGHRKILST